MNETKNEGLINCKLCFEMFNKATKRPKVLVCGHSFCSTCLEKVLLQNPRCPTCNAIISFTTAESIPVNFSLISLMFNVNHKVNSKYKSKVPCEVHDLYYKDLRCMDCEDWICCMCATFQHPNCKTFMAEEAYSELKNEVSLSVQKELSERKASIDKISDSLKALEGLKICEKQMEELESLKLSENKLCGNLKHLQELVENSQSYFDLSKARKKIDIFMEKKTCKHFDFKSVNDLTIERLESWCKEESVYAVDELGDTPLYGKVAVKDGIVRVYSFQSVKPNCRLIPFKELLSRFSGSTKLPKTGFLQMTKKSGDDEVAEVVIETDGTSPRAKNFILLCSALKSSSYKGMTLKWYSESFSYMVYPAPSPVVSGVTTTDPVFMDPPWEDEDHYDDEEEEFIFVKEGDLHGMDQWHSWFELQLKDNPRDSNPRVGVVVSGLQSLKDFHGGECSVTESGLII